jgi:cation:H+ antiporter
MQDYASLALGIIFAAAGGELFVRGAVGLARAARVSGAIIGATVAAFATSSPELAVAISAALEQKPQIALGDALGSNVVNIALILGLALLISPIQSPLTSVRRDFPVALAVPVVTAVLCFDGTLSRAEGALLLGLFVAWLVAVTLDARRQRNSAPAAAGASSGLGAAALGLIGLVLLFAAGTLIVSGARGIAESFGISEFVIGATIVAVGTSVPELATVVIAKLRGHDEIGLGTVLGSNIFNNLWIVPVAALIYPIGFGWPEVAVALAAGVIAMLAVFPPAHGLIGRGRGAVLVAVYAGYVAAILLW